MGRMKDQLGEAPATLGGVRALGATRLVVSCSPPCRHRAPVEIEALGLPDDTPFGEIATRKTFRCAKCDRRAVTLSVDWGISASRPIDPRS